MSQNLFSRGFTGRRREDPAVAARIPPGQYLTHDFPVLSAGPTPHTPLTDWSFAVGGAVETPRRWSWTEFRQLPTETITTDIHCVTKWSKLDTTWEGVSLDVLLAAAGPVSDWVTIWSDGGYTTNLPLAHLINGQAWVSFQFGGEPLTPEHGGPARLLVPHLYFWKSAKWVRGITLTASDQPGFWEQLGYHDLGDPWREQRYQGD